LEYFRDTTGMTVEPPVDELETVAKIVDDIWQNRDRTHNVNCLVKRPRRVDKEMSGEAVEQFARLIPDGDVGRFAESLSASLRVLLRGLLRSPGGSFLIALPFMRCNISPWRVEFVCPWSWLPGPGACRGYVGFGPARSATPQGASEVLTKIVAEQPSQKFPWLAMFRIGLGRPGRADDVKEVTRDAAFK
jgi:hypothetical protein